MDEQLGRTRGRDVRRLDLDRRLRFAFLAGAEKHSRDTLGRGLTNDELRRVIGRFPVDVSSR